MTPERLKRVIEELTLYAYKVDEHTGDILPMRLLERCDVQINQQKLFRGAIFEDDGSLFLTSLESMKTP